MRYGLAFSQPSKGLVPLPGGVPVGRGGETMETLFFKPVIIFCHYSDNFLSSPRKSLTNATGGKVKGYILYYRRPL